MTSTDDIITETTTAETITNWLDKRSVDYRITPEGIVDIPRDSGQLSLAPDEQDACNPGWAWYAVQRAGNDGDEHHDSGGLDSFAELAELLGLTD